ncbi:hypothetical protein GCM10009609_13910 [Pseudonocardia aurantiaca]
MRCYINGAHPPGVPGDSRIWFYVNEASGPKPRYSGFVFSDFVKNQAIVEGCTESVTARFVYPNAESAPNDESSPGQDPIQPPPVTPPPVTPPPQQPPGQEPPGQEPPGGNAVEQAPVDVPPAPKRFSETQGHFGSDTFTNYHNASGKGDRIAPGQVVEVSCKVLAPTIASVSPDGYWYRIASAPWNDSYYAAANTFLNGDSPGGPAQHNTDFTVPDC